jgi:hypothetical protein
MILHSNRGPRMTRDAMLRRLEAHDRLWDMVIVGGGATGLASPSTRVPRA